MYLNRVVKEHPGTPWAMLAKNELDHRLGWVWKDSFTDLTPKPKAKAAANNNNNAAPKNDQKKMLPPQPQKRPPPKL